MEENNTQSITAEVTPAAQQNAGGIKYANFFWRTAALFTDIWIYCLSLIISLKILSAIYTRILPIQIFDIISEILSYEIFSIPLIFFLLIAIKIFLYDSYSNGKTPGRLLYGLCVTDLEGKPLTFWKSVLRSIISMILLVCAVYGINELGFTASWKRNNIMTCLSISLVLGFDIFIFFTPLKQTLYDKLLGSVVVKKKEMTEKLGCFIYVLAIASFFIPFFVMLILSMLEGLKH